MIICDVEMPELDGYGVLHYLSNDPQTAMIPFIFLTSRDGAEEMRRGMTSGADDYLVKPFSEADLLATINVRLKKSAILQREYGRAPQRLSEFISDASEQQGIPGLDLGDRPRHYSSGQVLYGEGDPTNHVYYVASGVVKILRTDSYGKELIIELCKAGDFFGHGRAEGPEFGSAALKCWKMPKCTAFPARPSWTSCTATAMSMRSSGYWLVKSPRTRNCCSPWHTLPSGSARAILDLRLFEASTPSPN